MKVKLIYGTDTGNTEAVIDNHLLNQLENNDFEVETLQVDVISSEIWKNNERFILGIPTWYDGQLQTDWQDYFGSNDEVKLLVEQSGRERFKREIIRLCKTKGEMTYFEMKEQIDRKVLFDDKYYNEFIGGKIHSKHLKGIENA